MSWKIFIITIFVLVVALVEVVFLGAREDPVVLKTNLENLPMEIGKYKAQTDSFPKNVYKELNADKNIYRHYRDNEGHQVDLYLGYYGTLKGGRSTHNPLACLPGAGWAIIETGKVSIDSENYPDGVNVNYILSRLDGENNVMLHWYQTSGNKVLSTGIQQNVQRFLGRIFYNRSDGAYVQVSASADEMNILKVKSRIKNFARSVINLLPAFWPEEK